MAKKHPYIQFYTGDYLKDTRSLSLAAKGAWSDMIVFMHTAEQRGILQGTNADFARMIGGTLEETAAVLLELCLKKVCDKNELQHGVFQIVCRRMVREAEISAKKAVNGSIGGSKTQANRVAKTEQKSDYDIDNDIDIEIIEIGVPSKKFVSIRTKYAGEKPRRIYDLAEYFRTTGQYEQVAAAGWESKFGPFMNKNPGAVYDDDNHLYNALKRFEPDTKKQKSFVP